MSSGTGQGPLGHACRLGSRTAYPGPRFGTGVHLSFRFPQILSSHGTQNVITKGFVEETLPLFFPQILHSPPESLESAWRDCFSLCGTKFSQVSCGHSRDDCQQYPMHRVRMGMEAHAGVPSVHCRTPARCIGRDVTNLSHDELHSKFPSMFRYANTWIRRGVGWTMHWTGSCRRLTDSSGAARRPGWPWRCGTACWGAGSGCGRCSA